MNLKVSTEYLTFVTLILTVSPVLLAQTGSEVTVSGTVYYSGPHTGVVHVVAVDWDDILAYEGQPDVNELPAAGYTTISGPGPYSLTIPDALAGHSYVVVAQMDLDGSGFLSMESFQKWEPSGNNDGCDRGECDAPQEIPFELLESSDVDVYLSDYEPLCVLLDTCDADFISDYVGDMDYYGGSLWICQPHIGGSTAVHQVDPDTGQLIGTHSLGNGHAMSVEWIGDEMWLCCRTLTSWTVRQYLYNEGAFTQGMSYALPSSMDWDIVWSINIAWDGTRLWAQEKGPCSNIYKLDLSDGSLVEVISECDFTVGKWLGLGDISDICFVDGYLWAMNDDAPTFAQMAPDPSHVPPETHYTFALDPNNDVFDPDGRYYGMVKDDDLVYFIEGIDITNAGDEVIGRSHRIHTARIVSSVQDLAVPVYRFWSPQNSRHFYTISEAEKQYVQTTFASNIWTYETEAYYAFPQSGQAGLAAVYRFWSNSLGAHFYTISEAERDYVIDNLSAWTYEGPVFYAYPEGSQPVDASPVYRFWSESLSTHFYTISEAEKDYVIDNLPSWEYETIAWYAYE